MTLKALFVPHALYMAGLESGVRLHDWASLSALPNTASPEDVAFYIKCNTQAKLCVPTPVAESFDFLKLNDQLATLPADLQAAVAVSLNKLSDKNIADALTEEQKNLKLTCDIAEGDLLLFTYIEDEEDSSQPTGDNAFYDRLMAQISALRPFHQVCELPIFLAYLNSKKD